ncbi:MAG TPA: GNAT family protein [Burkholderiales bacterium]|nr:GNAT family protein [Burkholderiales bacterium]
MKLLPLDVPDVLELAARWLAQRENYQWLDFGNGRQLVTPALLKIMTQREAHFMRAYTSDRDDVPVGIVGLNSVDRVARTATLWAVAGDKSFSNRGYVSLASSRLLTLAFRDLALNAVNTWIVDGNPSVRSLQRLNFRFIGRQRQCHMIDGRPRDRLLFDLLAAEHEELAEERWRRIERSHHEAACGQS